MQIAIYAGTFDPPTNGHLECVKKSMLFCDELHIIIASSSKTTEFTAYERKKMWEDILWAESCLEENNSKKQFLINANVEILPEKVLLANYAKKINAKILIRGMRDTLDFVYEQKIENTNRQINPDLQSVFVMPSAETKNISSSWVKDLNKYKDSYDLLINAVNPIVLSALDKKKIWNLPIQYEFDKAFAKWNVENKFRYYHNFSHISKMIDDFYFEHDSSHHISTLLLEAILLHDSHSFNEDPTKIYLDKYRPSLLKDLVLATDYTQEKSLDQLVLCEEKDTPKQINDMKYGIALIRYLDLKILGSNPKEYAKYAELIQKEYYLHYCHENMNPAPFTLWKTKHFNPKRYEFLNKLIDRNIFLSPNEDFTIKYNLKDLEKIAKKNILSEMYSIERP